MAKQIESGWCSWCFKWKEHELVQRNYARRNVYQCRGCLGRTLQCRLCTHFARGHETYDDERCAKCDNTIAQWGQRLPDERGHCSWCFKEAAHRLIQKNAIQRDICECSHCGRRTLQCRSCKTAFARGHGTYDDERCIVCDGTVSGWENYEQFKGATSRVGWCSWCFDQNTHQLEQVNKVRRSVYACDGCGARTLPCSGCQDGMSRGGLGWDDQHCALCDKDVRDWDGFKRRKDEYISRPYSVEDIRHQLALETEERSLALNVGMIRPFLLLVSMDYATRNQIASVLGFSLYNQEYLGNPHKEAWAILDSKVKGLRRRATESWETLNPLAHNVNWYESLHRTGRELFQKLDAVDFSYRQSIDGCSIPNWTPLQDLEEEFIKKLGHLQAMHLTAEQLADLDKIEDSDEVRDLAKRLQTAGFRAPETIRHGIYTIHQVIRLGGFNSYIWTVKIAGAMNRKLGTKIVMSQATKSVARFASALNVVGWLWLAADMIDLAAGSSLGRLAPVIIQILNQRIWLAGEGVCIEEYYGASRTVLN